ncbi:MAG: PHA/PHB synthase family protein [Neptuniibacter sp.]
MKDKRTASNKPSLMGQEVLNGTISILQTSLKSPKKLIQEPFSLLGDLSSVLLGKSVNEASSLDRRFKDDTWEKNPVYKRVMETYLALSNRSEAYLNDLDLDEQNDRRSKFLLTNILSTISPTNTLIANPQALKKAYETGGASLLKGGKNFVDDLFHNGGMPSLVDKSAFEVGENLAVTEGKVIYRTNMLELIQYTPTTKQVHSTPLLMVPPQINKFYVYDIAPGRSFIEYIVSQGFQVFAVSWKNPGPDERDWNFNKYVLALEDVCEVINEVSGSDEINCLGACSGGITTASLLGYLAAKEIRTISSFTLLVGVLDSGSVGDTSLGLFIQREILEVAKLASSRSGILKGEDLAKIFAWLRPNDLIWPYWINNYLLGESPPEFDLLFWNSDTTNLPAGLHKDFLTMLEDNPLVKSGEFEIGGKPIDLKKVTCDSYVVAGSTDHITPWESCYKTVNLLGGKTDFILSSSGHVQAIINPTNNPKAEFFTTTDACKDSEEFLEKAERMEGSWWSHWSSWLSKRSGKKKAAPKKSGNDEYPVLGNAPGNYAREK